MMLQRLAVIGPAGCDADLARKRSSRNNPTPTTRPDRCAASSIPQDVPMVEIQIAYEGQLHCTATHTPSDTRLTTDAPKDNMGRGESFSPTDLVATALGTCILTTMAIVAERRGLELNGATARVTKDMVTTPSGRIVRLTVEVVIPQSFAEEDRTR